MSEQVVGSSQSREAALAIPPKAVISPLFDGLAIGGLSILVLPAILLFWPNWYGTGALTPPLRPLLDHVGEVFIIGTALVNWPHFMSTYGLLYRSKETVKQYPVASIWMPLALGVYCVAATVAGAWTPIPARLAAFAAGSYLAWHYTGQAWGMIATFTYLDKKSIPDDVRNNLRRSLRTLVAFHVGWFVYYVEPFGLAAYVGADTAHSVYVTYSALTLGVAAIWGALGTMGYIKHNRTMPGRVAMAWGSIWVWYIFMAIHPIGIFFVQLSHSLQYLIFPARIEANRARARHNTWPTPVLMLLFFAAWVLVGLAVFKGGPLVVSLLDNAAGGAGPASGPSMINPGIAFLSLGAFINIHHFFADSVIWRISNPNVRRELFSHLMPGK